MGPADGFQGNRGAAEADRGRPGGVELRWGIPTAAFFSATRNQQGDDGQGEDLVGEGDESGPEVFVARHLYVPKDGEDPSDLIRYPANGREASPLGKARQNGSC